MGAEAVARPQVEAGLAPFLLVGGDPLPANRMDRLQVHQARERTAQLDPALLARLGACLAVVPVTAFRTDPRLGGGDLSRVPGGYLDLGHLVPATLVVDQCARSELADGDEPGALDVAGLLPLPRDVGGQRKPREGVAGQEAFGGEVAVGVEVAELPVGVLILQQPQLVLRLATPPLGLVAGLRGRRVVQDPAVLFGLLGGGRAEQIPPPVAGGVESGGRVADGVLNPALVPPGAVAEALLGQEIGHHLLRPREGTTERLLVVQLEPQVVVDRQLIQKRDVEHLGHPGVQRGSRLGEPDGVHVRAHEIFVGEVQPRRLNPAGDHLFGTPEVVLVVRAAGGAVGGDQRGLSAPPGTP